MMHCAANALRNVGGTLVFCPSYSRGSIQNKGNHLIYRVSLNRFKIQLWLEVCVFQCFQVKNVYASVGVGVVGSATVVFADALVARLFCLVLRLGGI